MEGKKRKLFFSCTKNRTEKILNYQEGPPPWTLPCKELSCSVPQPLCTCTATPPCNQRAHVPLMPPLCSAVHTQVLDFPAQKVPGPKCG